MRRLVFHRPKLAYGFAETAYQGEPIRQTCKRGAEPGSGVRHFASITAMLNLAGQDQRD